jgi:predicted nucleic acid-binding Zn ribbon protein
MFEKLNGKKEVPELGGEIHLERKRRERKALIAYVISAFIILLVILFFLTES